MSDLQAKTLRIVADRIANNPESFDMDVFESNGSCGTVRCIAGHVGNIYGDDFSARKRSHWLWERKQASRIGLDGKSGNALFHGEFRGVYDGNYAAILRKIANKVEKRKRRCKLSLKQLREMLTSNN